MEKLKSYISALIEAAFGDKKAFIASQAVPNYAESVASEVTVTSGQDVVAPYDSIVSARTTLGKPNLKVACNVNSKLISSMYGINTGTNIATAFPVKKGDQINFVPAIDSEARVMSLCFFKLIGGGIKSFIKILQSGGELCLRLKNTLKKQWGYSPLRVSQQLNNESNVKSYNRKEPARLLRRQQAGLCAPLTLRTCGLTTPQMGGEWPCVVQETPLVTRRRALSRLIKGIASTGSFTRYLKRGHISTFTTPKLSNLSFCTQGGAL